MDTWVAGCSKLQSGKIGVVIDAFRIATHADAEAIVQLVNRVYRPQPGLGGWTHEAGLVSGNRINSSQVSAAIAKIDSAILLGLNDSNIIACVHVEKDGNNSHIGMLAVHASFQALGCGSQMLAHAEKYAVTIFAAEKLIMHVLAARNELIAFYSRRGYQATGVFVNYPLAANVGIPLQQDLKVILLKKNA